MHISVVSILHNYPIDTAPCILRYLTNASQIQIPIIQTIANSNYLSIPDIESKIEILISC